MRLEHPLDQAIGIAVANLVEIVRGAIPVGLLEERAAHGCMTRSLRQRTVGERFHTVFETPKIKGLRGRRLFLLVEALHPG